MHNFGYLGAHDGTVAFYVKNVQRVFVDSVIARISLILRVFNYLLNLKNF